jgi:hypothetical protein
VVIDVGIGVSLNALSEGFSTPLPPFLFPPPPEKLTRKPAKSPTTKINAMRIK